MNVTTIRQGVRYIDSCFGKDISLKDTVLRGNNRTQRDKYHVVRMMNHGDITNTIGHEDEQYVLGHKSVHVRIVMFNAAF